METVCELSVKEALRFASCVIVTEVVAEKGSEKVRLPSHLTKVYPKSGVAVIWAVVPYAKVPDPLTFSSRAGTGRKLMADAEEVGGQVQVLSDGYGSGRGVFIGNGSPGPILKSKARDRSGRNLGGLPICINSASNQPCGGIVWIGTQLQKEAPGWNLSEACLYCLVSGYGHGGGRCIEVRYSIARPSGEVVSGVRGGGDGDLASETVGSSRRIIAHGASGSGRQVQAVGQRREGCMHGLVPIDATVVDALAVSAIPVPD